MSAKQKKTNKQRATKTYKRAHQLLRLNVLLPTSSTLFREPTTRLYRLPVLSSFSERAWHPRTACNLARRFFFLTSARKQTIKMHGNDAPVRHAFLSQTEKQTQKHYNIVPGVYQYTRDTSCNAENGWRGEWGVTGGEGEKRWSDLYPDPIKTKKNLKK